MRVARGLHVRGPAGRVRVRVRVYECGVWCVVCGVCVLARACARLRTRVRVCVRACVRAYVHAYGRWGWEGAMGVRGGVVEMGDGASRVGGGWCGWCPEVGWWHGVGGVGSWGLWEWERGCVEMCRKWGSVVRTVRVDVCVHTHALVCERCARMCVDACDRACAFLRIET